MAKSEYTDLTYFMIYGYKLVKKSDYNEGSVGTLSDDCPFK